MSDPRAKVLDYSIELDRRYRVASVPTIIINGKYSTDVDMAGGPEQLFALIGELATSERSGK